jgi:hypothetical protein
MPGESRPMGGRNCVALLVVLVLAACGDSTPPGIRVQDLEVHSRAVHEDMPVKVVVPAGGRRRPLLVFLHGRSGDEGSYVHAPFLNALKALGPRAPVVAFPDGDAGAFDDAEDFARHDVVASPDRFTGLPVWFDAGDKDPFRPGDDTFAAALRSAGADATVHVWPGGHDGDYWNAHWGDYLRFYANALGRC